MPTQWGALLVHGHPQDPPPGDTFTEHNDTSDPSFGARDAPPTLWLTTSLKGGMWQSRSLRGGKDTMDLDDDDADAAPPCAGSASSSDPVPAVAPARVHRHKRVLDLWEPAEFTRMSAEAAPLVIVPECIEVAETIQRVNIELVQKVREATDEWGSPQSPAAIRAFRVIGLYVQEIEPWDANNDVLTT